LRKEEKQKESGPDGAYKSNTKRLHRAKLFKVTSLETKHNGKDRRLARRKGGEEGGEKKGGVLGGVRTRKVMEEESRQQVRKAQVRTNLVKEKREKTKEALKKSGGGGTLRSWDESPYWR